MTYERQFFQYLENLKRRIYAQPLNLGGVSSSGGGVGGPPGGFLGLLPQSRITYDKLEASSFTTPASGASLLDNLNHIRKRLDNVEASGVGGAITLQENDIVVASGVTTINFEGAVSLVDEGGNKVTVTVSGGGAGAGDFLTLTDTPTSYSGDAGKITAVNSTENALEFITLSGVNYNYTSEDLTLQIPATGDNYDLAYTPISGSVMLYYNGIAQQFNNSTILVSGVHTKFSPVSGDELITNYYRDAGDVTGITTVRGSGTDENAIHDNIANEISAIEEKIAPVGADIILIEDSEASYIKKKLKIENLPTASGAGASNFLSLTDTPSSYSGQAGKVPVVASGADSLGFTTVGFPAHICKVERSSSNQTLSNWTYINWDTEIFDTDSSWSSGAATYVYVPNGFTKAKATVFLTFKNGNSSSLAVIYHNATVVMNDMRGASNEGGKSFTTGWMTVSDSDYFRVQAFGGILSGIQWGGSSWFEVEFDK